MKYGGALFVKIVAYVKIIHTFVYVYGAGIAGIIVFKNFTFRHVFISFIIVNIVFKMLGTDRK